MKATFAFFAGILLAVTIYASVNYGWYLHGQSQPEKTEVQNAPIEIIQATDPMVKDWLTADR